MRRESPARATVVATALFVGGLLCGTVTGRAAVERARDPYQDLGLFARVLATIEEDYVDEIPAPRLVDAAIGGMLDLLDDQSRWLDADQLQDIRDDADGATTGIGVEILATPEGAEVVKVVPDSPASRDGLLSGDRILAIDGQPLAGLDARALHARFEGPRGAPTRLEILRDGWDGPRLVETTRDRVQREVVGAEAVPGLPVVYARLAQFQDRAAEDLVTAVTRASAPIGGLDAVHGLVLDLRDNPGGLLTEAVAVADLFLDEGVIVRTKGRHEGDEEQFDATSGGFRPDLAVVVLANGMSASASEIVVAALQDTKRAVIVGERTYGKGTVQQVYLHTSPGEAALKLTVGRYYTPSGAPVAPRDGRPPDREVAWPSSPTTLDALGEKVRAASLPEKERADLLVLVEGLRTEGAARAVIPWDEPLPARLQADPQLRAAVDLLR